MCASVSLSLKDQQNKNLKYILINYGHLRFHFPCLKNIHLDKFNIWKAVLLKQHCYSYKIFSLVLTLNQRPDFNLCWLPFSRQKIPQIFKLGLIFSNCLQHHNVFSTFSLSQQKYLKMWNGLLLFKGLQWHSKYNFHNLV